MNTKICCDDYKIRDGELEEEYIYRICSLKDSIGTWESVADILNSELHYEYTSSKYRKQFSAYVKMYESLNHDDEFQRQLEELKKEKQKIRDLTSKYNELIRNESRQENQIELMIEAIKNYPTPKVPEVIISPSNEKAGIVAFGDSHLGKILKIYGLKGEILNEYNEEIFYQRMWKLRDDILAICGKEQLDKIVIFDVGDSIEGMLRVKALASIKYGAMDSGIMYAKFVSEWLNSISKHVFVEYKAITGNHEQTRPFNSKNGDFPSENIGRFVSEYIKAYLRFNPNVVVDTGLNYSMIYANVVGYNILATHGEEKNKQNAIMEYENIYDIKINFLISGHNHHGQTKEVGFHKDYIGVGSIIGIDDYSLSLKRVSNPTAKFIVLEKDKGRIEYTIEL